MPEQPTPLFSIPENYHSPEALADKQAYIDRVIELYEQDTELPKDVTQFVANLAPKTSDPTLSPQIESLVRLACCNLMVVRERYGVNANHPGVIKGTVEEGVLATYHNGTHTGDTMMTFALAYAYKCNEEDVRAERQPTFSILDLALIVFITSGHDGIQGHGRGTDELLSAEAAVEILRRANIPGMDEEDFSKAYYGVGATAFDPQKGTQSVDENMPHLHIQKAVAIGDLLGLAMPDGPMRGIAHVAEFFMSTEPNALSSWHQVLTRIAQERGFDLLHSNIWGVLDLIDQDEEARGMLAKYLLSQSKFFRGHVYPDERVDQWFPLRETNARLYDALAQDYLMGYITAVGAYAFCAQYAQQMYAELRAA
jgi:hypothetical protein